VWTGNQIVRSSSLRKLKEDITPVTNVALIDDLPIVEFTWKRTNEKDIGMVYEEVLEIDERLTSFQDWRERPVLALAVAAIQDLRRRVLVLETTESNYYE